MAITAAGARLTRRLSDTATAAVTTAAVTTTITRRLGAVTLAIAVTVARRLGAVTLTFTVARRLGAVAMAFAITFAVARWLRTMTLAIAIAVTAAGLMFARLRRLCLPGATPRAVRLFAGGRALVVSVRPGPGFGPRLFLAVVATAWRAALVVAAIAALTALA